MKKEKINEIQLTEKQLLAKKSKELRTFNAEKIKSYQKNLKRKNIPQSEFITTMKNNDNILEIEGLKTYFYTDMGTVKAVDGININIPKGSTVGIVGESGCGKSVTSLSIMRIVQGPVGQIAGGQIRYNQGNQAIDLAHAPIEVMRSVRGKEISMIFQEPMTSMNPIFTIGYQIDEIITLHNPSLKKNEVKNRTIEMLKLVGIARAEGIYTSYPHELSGGMRQRAMIAMSLACSPKLIIADEPTTALDVTIQAQILELLRDVKQKISGSIILITHDLGVVAEMADYVVVMYAGRVIEQGTTIDVFKTPKHPYTIGLMKSKPVVNQEIESLYSIPGQVPNPIKMPNHCYFKDRCEYCIKACDGIYPELTELSTTHKVACYNALKPVKRGVKNAK